MRIGVIVFLTAVVLTGCSHLNINKNMRALKRVQPGDTQAVVFKALGPPDLRHDISDRRFVAFYQTTPDDSSDAPMTTTLCTPVAFYNGHVVAVGEDPTERWTQEEKERKRQLKIAESKRVRIEKEKAAGEQKSAARQAEIDVLEKAVKPIPASNAALNLKLYRQLLDLDPGNTRYRKKVTLYEARSARQKKAHREHAALQAKERQRQAWELARETRNKNMRQYTGNGTAEMAVHDMGKGSLYVWVKNVSKQMITTHPDNFTLVDSDNDETRCRISDSLDSVLEPGSLSHGKIEYSPEILPKELIFQNRESGRVSKSFR